MCVASDSHTFFTKFSIHYDLITTHKNRAKLFMQNGFNQKFFSSEMDSFKDRFVDIMERSEKLIINLQKTETAMSSAAELYAAFRSLKSYAEMLHIETFVKVFRSLEDLFGVLRHREKPADKSIIDWILMVNDVMLEWVEALRQESHEFEPVDSYTLNMMKVAVLNSGKNRELLKSLSLLIIDQHAEISSRLSDYFQHKFKRVTVVKNVQEAGVSQKCDFVVFNANIGDSGIIEYIKNINKDFSTPIIVSYDKSKKKQISDKFNEIYVDGFIEKPVDLESLVLRIVQLCEMYYAEKSIHIMDTKILELVQALQPFPKTVSKIQKISSDPESSLRDLSIVIAEDPLLSAKMLTMVNSPHFGLSGTVSNTNQAVTMLGRDKAAALCMQISIGQGLNIDLSPYSIGMQEFYEISQKRMELMNAWYSKVSFSSLPILTTSALLGNIGQIIFCEALRKKQLQQKFVQQKELSGVQNAEIEVLGVLSEDVTADMLTFWKLDPLLIDSIRFAFDLTSAIDDVRPLAIANFVVYTTVSSISSKIDEKVVVEMVDFLKEMNLKPQHYLAAIEKIEQNSKERQ